MSLIVWDGKTLAVDSAYVQDTLKYSVHKSKHINRMNSDVLIAAVGNIQCMNRVAEYYSRPTLNKEYLDATDFSNAVVMVIHLDARPGPVIEVYDGTAIPLTINSKTVAYGSAAKLANYLLYHGYDSRTIMQIANDHSASLGGPYVYHDVSAGIITTTEESLK